MTMFICKLGRKWAISLHVSTVIVNTIWSFVSKTAKGCKKNYYFFFWEFEKRAIYAAGLEFHLGEGKVIFILQRAFPLENLTVKSMGNF